MPKILCSKEAGMQENFAMKTDISIFSGNLLLLKTNGVSVSMPLRSCLSH